MYETKKLLCFCRFHANLFLGNLLLHHRSKSKRMIVTLAVLAFERLAREEPGTTAAIFVVDQEQISSAEFLRYTAFAQEIYQEKVCLIILVIYCILKVVYMIRPN